MATKEEIDALTAKYVEKRKTLVDQIGLLLNARGAAWGYYASEDRSYGVTAIRLVNNAVDEKTEAVIEFTHETSGFPSYRATGRAKVKVTGGSCNSDPVTYHENSDGVLNIIKIADRAAMYQKQFRAGQLRNAEEMKKENEKRLRAAQVKDWVKSQEPLAQLVTDGLKSNLDQALGSEPTEFGKALALEILTRLMAKYQK